MVHFFRKRESADRPERVAEKNLGVFPVFPLLEGLYTMAFLTVQFTSEVLQVGCSLHAILPQNTANFRAAYGGPPRRPFPVLWLFHGLSDDHSAWSRQTSIERYAYDRGLAVIMPAVNRSFYTNMVAGAPYGRFIRQELPMIARSFFPLSEARADNFTAGLSMGGLGAFLQAMSAPEHYAAAASLSGVLDPKERIRRVRREAAEGDPAAQNFERELVHILGDLDAIEDHPDYLPKLAERMALRHRQGLEVPQLYACCGTEDFLYEDNLAFRKHAQGIGLPLTYEEGPGGHDWAFWDLWIQRVIAWLPIGQPGYTPSR